MVITVMIVYDSTRQRQIVSTALQGAGYDVLEACDGADALRQLDGRQVHLVISDVNVPDRDGLTLLKQIQAMPGYRFLPVIMLTAENLADNS